MEHIKFINAQQAKLGTLKTVAKATETCTRILLYWNGTFLSMRICWFTT